MTQVEPVPCPWFSIEKSCHPFLQRGLYHKYGETSGVEFCWADMEIYTRKHLFSRLLYIWKFVLNEKGCRIVFTEYGHILVSYRRRIQIPRVNSLILISIFYSIGVIPLHSNWYVVHNYRLPPCIESPIIFNCMPCIIKPWYHEWPTGACNIPWPGGSPHLRWTSKDGNISNMSRTPQKNGFPKTYTDECPSGLGDYPWLGIDHLVNWGHRPGSVFWALPDLTT